MAPQPAKPLKILMLHGFTQSGPLFRAKTRALEKNLQKAFPSCTLHYPTAPIRLPPSDLTFAPSSTSTDQPGAADDDAEPPDAWGWWRRTGDAEPYVYEGIEAGMARIAEALREDGPFDGVVGFSQGGAAAALVASLLDPGRREAFAEAQKQGGMRYPESFEEEGMGTVHPPLRFAVSYSGFRTTENALYRAFYEPKIKTPMLHFLGSLDTVVEEKRSLKLVEECENSEGRVVYHPGGHFLPSSQKAYVSALINFIKEILSGADADSKEEKAE